jgi:Cu/Ag efflux protein CusF
LEVSEMRKLFVMFVAVSFLLSGLAMASGPAPATPAAPPATKIAVKSATGVVKELSDKMLKLERKVKGKIHAMDFVLKTPLADIKVGDDVKVNYVVEDGKNVVKKVKKIVPKAKGQAPIPPAGTKGPAAASQATPPAAPQATPPAAPQATPPAAPQATTPAAPQATPPAPQGAPASK